jgi:hypothetical protein
MPPTLADLENWLSFGRYDPHRRTNGATAPNPDGPCSGKKRALALITLKKSPGGW